MDDEWMKEGDDFGFEGDTLYLNFSESREGLDRLFDGAGIRKMADALNQLLPDDHQIVCFRTF